MFTPCPPCYPAAQSLSVRSIPHKAVTCLSAFTPWVRESCPVRAGPWSVRDRLGCAAHGHKRSNASVRFDEHPTTLADGGAVLYRICQVSVQGKRRGHLVQSPCTEKERDRRRLHQVPVVCGPDNC